VTAAPGHRPAPARAGGDVPRRWRFPVLLLETGLAVIMVASCGSSGPPPPWRSGHPDPSSLSLLDSAQAGSCASKAPDPDQAPAAISFQSHEYVQTSRTSASSSAAPGAFEIDHAGDWSFWDEYDGNLTMTTPQADYLYKPASC
jgi:hypothetical protein